MSQVARASTAEHLGPESPPRVTVVLEHDQWYDADAVTFHAAEDYPIVETRRPRIGHVSSVEARVLHVVAGAQAERDRRS